MAHATTDRKIAIDFDADADRTVASSAKASMQPDSGFSLSAVVQC
jgi:hypothetical protein